MNRVLTFFLGRRSDWHLTAPRISAPTLSLHWLGPIAMVVSVIASWFAFTGTAGLDQASTFSMWFGASSILLMAWSFILALRVSFLERFWGGLDSMYRGHRWAGALAIPAMFMHTSIEPAVKGAQLIAGANANVADAAEELAETGELMLYGLIGISLLRLIPYRWWKWTHKLFGIPFAFASWHFYTAQKPYDNASGWGMWFAGFMLVGLIAWIARVVVRDAVAQGSSYTVVDAQHVGSLTRIELAPDGRSSLDFDPGQFAFLRFGAKGMREPHPFSIASGPSSKNLTFYIRHLGDWSDRLPDTDLLGTTVRVEAPYGEFTPISRHHTDTVWIAGGVGITPFLASLDELTTANVPPTVLYACKTDDGDPLVELLRIADEEGKIRLHLYTNGSRLTPDALDDLFPHGMSDCHVALCGPAGLVKDMASASNERGARSVETEDFDIRQGFGPDRSREIDAATRKVIEARSNPVTAH